MKAALFLALAWTLPLLRSSVWKVEQSDPNVPSRSSAQDLSWGGHGGNRGDGVWVGISAPQSSRILTVSKLMSSCRWGPRGVFGTDVTVRVVPELHRWQRAQRLSICHKPHDDPLQESKIFFLFIFLVTVGSLSSETKPGKNPRKLFI